MFSQQQCRSFRFQVAIWFCTFAVASVLACGSDSDSAPAEQPSSREADTGELPKILSGGDHQPAAQAGGIEVDLPDDLPIYPGAKIVQAGDGVDGSVSLTLETGDPASSVATKISALLEQAGWYIQKANKGKVSGIFADKGGRTLSALIERKGEVTTISMLILVLE